MQLSANFYQIRYLEESGQELVRLNRKNGKIMVVPEDELQNKSHRYYFQEALKLKPDQTYFSQIDLNIEHGKIERPLKPQWRVAKAIYSSQGEIKGVVIINLRLKELLTEVEKFTFLKKTKGINLFLINEEGYYLKSPPTPHKEWGEKHNLGTGYNFKKEYPNLFTKLNKNNSKHTFFSYPYFIFSQKIKIGPENSFLILGSLVPWWEFYLIVTRELFPLIMLLLLGLLILYLIFRSVEQKLKEEDLTNLKLRHAIENSPSVLIISNPEGIIQYVNFKFETLTGYSYEEVIGQKTSLLKSGLTPEETYQDLWEKISNGKTWTGQLQNKKKNQEIYWEEAKIAPILNRKGKITSFIKVAEDITLRKTSEERIKKSEAFLKQSQEIGKFGSYEYDYVNNYWIASETCLKIFGLTENRHYTAEEFQSLVHPDDSETFMKIVSDSLKTKNDFNYEYRCIKKNTQETIWVESRSKILRDKNGKPLKILGIIQDITERKKIQSLIDETQEKHQQLFTSMGQGVVYQNAKGEITDANKAAQDILGLTLDQMQGRTSIDPRWKAIREDGSNFPGEEHPAMVALKTGVPVDGVIMGVFHPKKEEYRWILVASRPQFKKGEQSPYLVFSTFTDISENRKSQEIIKESEKRFRETFNEAPIGIAHVSQEGKWLRANKKLAQIIGYPPEELLKLTFQDITHPEDLDKDLDYVKKMLNGSLKNYSMEKRYLRKDKRIIWVKLTVSLVYLEDGKPDYFVSMIEDISERKVIEEKLQKATLAAQSANEAKSEFLSNMSHELRTPLNSVIGFSEVLKDETFGPLNEKQKSYVEDVLTSGKHLLSLINDILDLSKIEAGQMTLSETTFSLATLLEESIVLFREKALKHQIKLETDIAPDVAFITSDERKVKQIIYNLVSNAVKYTPDKGQVKIIARKKGKLFEISVWDTGEGIQVSDQAKIFNEFLQLENAITKKHEGTGLGLSLTKRLVELLGGSIRVVSAGKDKGSTFIFTLPAKSKGGEK